MKTRWKRRICTAVLFLLAVGAGACLAGQIVKKEQKQSVRTEEAEDSENTGKVNIRKKQQEESTQKEDSRQEQKEQAEEESKQTEAAMQAEEIRRMAERMTIEEKAAQLFVVTPDALTGVDSTIMAGDLTRQCYWERPVGGFILMSANIQSEEQVMELNAGLKRLSLERTGVVPFLCVDEEGGAVVRIASNEAFPQENIGDMMTIGASGDPSRAYQAGLTLGTYLSAYGFNLDLAPVADVLVNPQNTVIGSRSFGSDADLVASMVGQEVEGLHEAAVGAALKHFPGHGATAEDSHEGFAYSMRTLDEIRACELKPFAAGIQSGAEFVMAGHVSYPNINGDDTPATLSGNLIQGLLREEMGFSGIVITDAMNMGAISNQYTSGQAAVQAIQAGVDMILAPADFEQAYQAVVAAVYSGEISEERLEESVQRILYVKQKYN